MIGTNQPRLSLLFFALAVLLPVTSRGQATEPEVNDAYEMRQNVIVTGQLRAYDTATSSCSPEGQNLGGYAKLIVFAPGPEAHEVVVVLKNNNQGTAELPMADAGELYCLSELALQQYFQKTDSSLAYGVVTVPFKMRFNPLRLMAGGSLGGYLGKTIIRSNDFTGTAFGFASLTNVPLSDLDNLVPETKWGVALGLGFVMNVAGEFQAGVVSGIDLFEGAGDWPYKYKPWVSLSIGYGFLSGRTSAAEELRTAQAEKNKR